MAQFDISGSVDPLLSVTLNKGESLFAESNAMVAMDGTLSLSGRTKGGFFKSLARKFLNDETFFQQKITAEDEGGHVLLGNSGGLFVMATEGEGRVAVLFCCQPFFDRSPWLSLISPGPLIRF